MNHVLGKFETQELIEDYAKLLQRFPEYAEYAQELSNEAESYRNFDVGAVLCGFEAGFPEPTIFTGSNYKADHSVVTNPDSPMPGMEGLEGELFEDDEVESQSDPDLAEIEHELHTHYGIPTRPDKNCAEMTTLWKLEEYEEEKLRINKTMPNLFAAGFIIAATVDPKEIAEVTGSETKTLPPCLPCADQLYASPATSRATLYISTGYSPRDHFEVRSIRHIYDVHRSRVENSHPHPSRLAPNLGELAVEVFKARMKQTQLPERVPSRTISTIARHALLEAGRAV